MLSFKKKQTFESLYWLWFTNQDDLLPPVHSFMNYSTILGEYKRFIIVKYTSRD